MNRRNPEDIEALKSKVLKAMTSRKAGFAIGEIGQRLGYVCETNTQGMPRVIDKNKRYLLVDAFKRLRSEGKIGTNGAERVKLRYVKIVKAKNTV